MKEGKAGPKNNTFNEDADAAKANAEAQRKAYDEMIKALGDIEVPTTKPTTDTTVNPYVPYDPNDDGGSKDEDKNDTDAKDENLKRKLNAYERKLENSEITAMEHS
jgi:hypothetical protein